MEICIGKSIRKVLMAVTVMAVLLNTFVMPSLVEAYGPSTMFKPSTGVPAPGALYARAMQASNGKMYATFEQYTTGVSVFPIYESANNGQSWTKVGDVKDTHKGVGMRWEPQLYELPQPIGNMPAGTLLCAGLVLPYDRSFCEIDLYKSNDSGRNWSFVSTIAVGKVATPGNDPVWEPFLLVDNNKLICYYSDERDSAYSQKLVHQTTTDGINWGSVVNDVAISNQRPGMVEVAKMPNGNYIMTYEIVGTGGAYYKISSNPESWNAKDAGTCFDSKGSSPYCVVMNGTVILSSAGNNNLYTNTNNGTGGWTQISCVIGSCYSRCLVPLSNGRLFVIGAGWNGSGLNSVTYGDMAGPVGPATSTPTKVTNTPTPTKVTNTPTPTKVTIAPTSTPTPTVSTGDLNKDGVINMADVILLANVFNSTRGDSKFVDGYDLNRDGVINMADVIFIAGKFNTTVKNI
ncbi:MAG: dockerin type I domain-containing protein [Bacillota bacterium]|nr:dockerin type I domain-containing protein [Bacillota bacterium]